MAYRPVSGQFCQDQLGNQFLLR